MIIASFPSPLIGAALLTLSGRDLAAILAPVVLGFLGICLLLPKPRSYSRVAGAGLAALAVLLAGILWIKVSGWSIETVLFFLFAGLAIVGGGMLVTQRNPVYAALSFALVILSTCGLFLLQAAPFLMAATIIVYAGAIIVTFLFVVMLAQQAGLSDADRRTREPFLASVAGFVLLATLVYILHHSYQNRATAPAYDGNAFAALLKRAGDANQKTTVTDVSAALGQEASFFEEIHRTAESIRGTPGSILLAAKAKEFEAAWPAWKKAGQTKEMHAALRQLSDLGEYVRGRRTADGRARMPAQNVAFLGQTLFTDYLLAVELGGTLLLVATIGAIAITSRRPESVR